MTRYKHAIIAESLRDDPANDCPAGTQTIHFGKNADPSYDVLTEGGPKRITHDIVERIEAPRKMTKAEFKKYIQDEVLPLGEEEAAPAKE